MRREGREEREGRGERGEGRGKRGEERREDREAERGAPRRPCADQRYRRPAGNGAVRGPGPATGQSCPSSPPAPVKKRGCERVREVGSEME